MPSPVKIGKNLVFLTQEKDFVMLEDRTLGSPKVFGSSFEECLHNLIEWYQKQLLLESKEYALKSTV